MAGRFGGVRGWTRRNRAVVLLLLAGLSVAALPFMLLDGGSMRPDACWLTQGLWGAIACAPALLGLLLIVQLMRMLNVRSTPAHWWAALGSVLLFYAFFALTYAGGFAACHHLDQVIMENGSKISGYWSEVFYFSVVTGATIGYGDMYPVGWGARALAICEMVEFWLFLAVAINIIQGPLERREAREGDGGPKADESGGPVSQMDQAIATGTASF